MPRRGQAESCGRGAVLTRVAIAALVVTAAVLVGPPTATAQDAATAEQQLAERYAPVVFVKPQDAPCDTNGEPFEPAPVEIVLDNPEVFLRQVGNDDPVAMRAPSAADLFDLREGWYLDFPGDALEPGCIFEQDFRRFFDGRSVVYAHVATEPDRPGWIALQYWFFWYHNPAKNDHEGDWEFIQLLFEAGSVAEALDTQPSLVGYAQHTGGERSDWDDDKLDKIDGRPVVYAARGSHASYYDQALFLGRSGREGFGCDNTDGATRRLDPSVVLLPDEVDDAGDPLAWLAFQGRWGQRESGFFNGPTGPFAKDRWDLPVTWQDGLRNSSVVVPGGDRQGDTVVNAFCRTVEFGSDVLVFGLRSPATAVSLLLIVLIVSGVLASRTRWFPVRTVPLRDDRAIGQIIRCSLRIWRDHPLVMVWVGLIYVPVAFATSLIQVVIQWLPFVDRMLALAGDHSALAMLFAIFVGGFGNLLAFVYVSAVVARTMDGQDWQGGRLPMLDRASLLRLVRAVLRAALIVVVLLLSIVGIPWAIRQLIRYQLVPQAVVLEGAEPRAALARSSQLVRGRWWWTAGVIAVLQFAIGLLGFGFSLTVLVLVTSIPLWLFNVLSAMIFVVLIPVGAAAMAYVYGTLVTRPAGEDARIDADPDNGVVSPQLS
jgi:hypothetical protein